VTDAVEILEDIDYITRHSLTSSNAAMRVVSTYGRRIAHSPVISSHAPRFWTGTPLVRHLGPYTYFLRNDDAGTTLFRIQSPMIVDRQYVLVASPRSLVGNRKRVRVRSSALVLSVLDSYAALELVTCRS
jgi:hypothetical protein